MALRYFTLVERQIGLFRSADIPVRRLIQRTGMSVVHLGNSPTAIITGFSQDAARFGNASVVFLIRFSSQKREFISVFGHPAKAALTAIC